MPNPSVLITGQVKVISYSCRGSNCFASDDKKHMKPGDAVVMLAKGTDVKIKFLDNKSPFVSGVMTIRIPQNQGRVEIVKRSRSRSDRYLYKLSCSCGGGPSTDPSMMVP